MALRTRTPSTAKAIPENAEDNNDKVTTIAKEMTSSIKGFLDKRPSGSLLNFQVRSDHVLIGDFCNAHEAALELSAGIQPTYWHDPPQFKAIGTVFSNDISCAVPAMRGEWKAARLFHPSRGPPNLCGAAFWRVATLGHSVEAAAKEVHAMVADGGDMGQNVESEQAVASGWRFVGRYSWQYMYYRSSDAKQNEENLLLAKDHENRMDMDAVYQNVMGGPVCTFLDSAAYWERLWPMLRKESKPNGAEGEEIEEEQPRAPLGLLALPEEEGVAACFGDQEYCFARIRFAASPPGPPRAVFVVCYTYACPDSLLEVQVEDAPVQHIKPPHNADAGALLAWFRGLSDADAATYFAAGPKSHMRDLAVAIFRSRDPSDPARAAELGLLTDLGAQPFFWEVVVGAMVAGGMAWSDLFQVLASKGAAVSLLELAQCLLDDSAYAHRVWAGVDNPGSKLVAAMQFLLDQGLPPAATLPHKSLLDNSSEAVPLLHRAVHLENPALVRMLLARGANVQQSVVKTVDPAHDSTKLSFFRQSGRVTLPTDHAPAVPLRAAMEQRNLEIVLMLAEAGGGAGLTEAERDGLCHVAVASFADGYEGQLQAVLSSRRAQGPATASDPAAVVAGEAEGLRAVAKAGLGVQEELVGCVRAVQPDVKAYAARLQQVAAPVGSEGASVSRAGPPQHALRLAVAKLAVGTETGLSDCAH